MLDIEEIDNTIETLENSSTTFDNVLKLASLYIVKEHMQNVSTGQIDVSESELKDILPAYRKYVDVKKEFQLNHIDKSALISSMNIVCKEIHEFLTTLYQNTECIECRELLIDMIHTIEL